MEVPEMVRIALSELIQAAVMAEAAAVMVYRGLWRRGHGNQAKHVGVRVGVLLVHACVQFSGVYNTRLLLCRMIEESRQWRKGREEGSARGASNEEGDV
jgi:hypothetical protein